MQSLPAASASYRNPVNQQEYDQVINKYLQQQQPYEDTLTSKVQSGVQSTFASGLLWSGIWLVAALTTEELKARYLLAGFGITAAGIYILDRSVKKHRHLESQMPISLARQQHARQLNTRHELEEAAELLKKAKLKPLERPNILITTKFKQRCPEKSSQLFELNSQFGTATTKYQTELTKLRFRYIHQVNICELAGFASDMSREAFEQAYNTPDMTGFYQAAQPLLAALRNAEQAKARLLDTWKTYLPLVRPLLEQDIKRLERDIHVLSNPPQKPPQKLQQNQQSS